MRRNPHSPSPPSLWIACLAMAAGYLCVADGRAADPEPEENGEDQNEQWSPFESDEKKLGLRTPILSARGEDETFADRAWQVPVLHRNPDGFLFQEIRITGRYHGQFASVNSKRGSWSGWDNRRIRGGLVVDFLRWFRLRLQAKGEGEEGLFDSSSLEDAWVAWRPVEEFTLKLGQFKPRWSYDWSHSSDRHLTMEFYQFVDQFRPRRATGVSAGAAIGQWAGGLEVFSGNMHDGDWDDDDGRFIVANLGFDFGEKMDDWDRLRWRLDYLYNNDSEQIRIEQSYRHAVATHLEAKRGRWGGVGEVTFINGMDPQANAFGFMLQPSYDIIPEKLQVVGRYNFSNSAGDGLLLRKRYELKPSKFSRGDEMGTRYQAGYLGLNWYIRGNQLKFMAGVEYANMVDNAGDGGDYNGWTVMSGVRFSF